MNISDNSKAGQADGIRRWMLRALVAVGFIVSPVIVAYLNGAFDQTPPTSETEYSTLASDATCPARTFPTPIVDRINEELSNGWRVSIRPPRNYDPQKRHPLLLVFAPAGYGRSASERYYNMNAEATRRGFVVAYVDARPLNLSVSAALSKVADELVAKWCIDREKIVYAGHSDGATSAYGIALRHPEAFQPKLMVLSGGGISGADLKSEKCPKTRSALIIHGSRDTHFPRFGAEAAEWWSKCLACEGLSEPQGICRTAVGCASGSSLMYCEPDQEHIDPPQLSDVSWRFIENSLLLN